MVKRYRSQSGRYVALIPDTLDSGFSVTVTAEGVAAFNERWPCSRLREKRTRFDFASNGDLIDVSGNQPDGEELLALSNDAQAFGEKCKAKLNTPQP